MDGWTRNPASFRDPSGFVFERDGAVYRQVNESFGDEFDRFMNSGLYADLARSGLLIEHEEDALRIAAVPRAHVVLRPTPVPFISYPYEWCHGQLKDAALLTLELQKRALARGFTLRDASAYNVQFLDGRPVWIDTLSFGVLVEGEPWPAYRQFCQHFLAPLALVSLVDASLGRLSAQHIDGVPLELAASVLPAASRLRPGLLTHLHLHARSIKRSSGAGSTGCLPPRPGSVRRTGVSRAGLRAFAESLQATIERLTWQPSGTWTQYSVNNNYSPAAQRHKEMLVRGLLAQALGCDRVSTVWDLGGNTGTYGRVAAGMGLRVVVMDTDPGAIELLYRDCRSRGEKQILPLVQDLTNPSAAIGWANEERRSLLQRGPVDLVLALALVHHLAIANNVPLGEVARFFSSLGRWLIVEFVDKEDSQVQRILSTRADVFGSYHQAGFEAAFARYFDAVARCRIDDSKRTLYLMRATPMATALSPEVSAP